MFPADRKEFVKLSGSIFWIAAPMVIQFLSEYILTSTDMAFIGHYRLEGLAAINNVIQPFFFLLSLFFALSQGATILISQSIGAGNKEQAKKHAQAFFFFNQILSLLYFLFWFFLGENVLVLIGARGEILGLGSVFIRNLSFIFLFMGWGISAGAVFQAIGKTFPIMAAALIKTGLNIFLAWALIFGNLGFPQWGVGGSAIASVISEAVSSIILTILVFRQKELALSWKGVFRPVYQFYIKIVKISLPIGAESLLWGIGPVIIIAFLNQVNPIASGHYGIINVLIVLSVYIYMGISIAALTLVGQATGAKKHREAIAAGNLCLFYSLFVCLLIGAIFLSFPKAVLSLFTKDPKTLEYLASLMLLLVFVTFPKAVNIVAGNSIRGTGDTKWMFYTQIFGTLFTLVSAWFFIVQFKWGLRGVLFLVLLDEVIRGGVNYMRFLFGPQFWLKKRQLDVS
jgi:putative MATE family efflux protein